MPNLIVANTTSIKAAGLDSSMGLSAAQELLSSLGFVDQRAGIIRESRAYHNKYIRLRTAIEKYEKNPDPKTRMALLKELKKEIKSLKEEYERIKEKQVGYQQVAMQADYKNVSWSGWLINNIKQFFGSDNEYQAERYGEIAETRKEQIKKLKKYQDELKEKNKSEKIEKEIIELSTNDVSPVSRKLLSLSQDQGQFPAVVELSNLNSNYEITINGVSATSAVASVSAGDINHDGIDDVFIGAVNIYGITPNISYVVFGSVTWPATIELSNLDGNNGFMIHNPNGYYGGLYVHCIGDVNNDGINDLAIEQSPGEIDVIFGKMSWPAIVDISNLNGNNGFAAFGVGFTRVADAGDINKDGITDLIMGSPKSTANGKSNAGVTYLLFGRTNWPASIILSTITGSSGVIINGAGVENNSGASVAGLGDVNNDGIADVLIGAWGASPPGRSQAGISYVVFGRMSWPASIELSSLNGGNGFAINGVLAQHYSGWTVSKVGDVNHDGIADLLTVAIGGKNWAGISYIVFGRTSWPASIELSSLNGNNGFVINGDSASDQSGYSVNVAGDVNGDSFLDLVIGAPTAKQSSGITYVVFGRSTWPGVIELSNLDGKNGFAINGTVKSEVGGSVSNEGDVNHDGIADILIAAIGPIPSKGKCYVVFGDVTPQLTENQLTINNGQTLIFNSHYLNATDFNHIATSLRFNISNLTHIRFELVNSPGISITAFNQTQVWSSQIQVIHDGSGLSPTYAVSTYSPGLAFLPATPAMINFISEPVVSSSTGVSSSSSSTADSVSPVSSSSSTADASSSTANNESSSSTANAEDAHSSSSTGESDEVSSSSSSSGLGVATNSSSSTGGGTEASSSAGGITGGSTGSNSSTVDSSSGAPGIAASSSTGGTAGSSGAAASSSGAVSSSAVNGGNSSSTAGASGSADSTADSTGSNNITSPVVSGPEDPLSRFFKVENPVMWGAIGGVAGTLLLLWITLRCYFRGDLQNVIEKEEKASAGNNFKKKIICPIVKGISKQVKITGCLGYIDEKTFDDYVTETQALVTKIQKKHYDYKDDRDGVGEANFVSTMVQLITDSARPARCSPAWWGSFFSHEITPIDIRNSEGKVIEKINDIKGKVKLLDARQNSKDAIPPTSSLIQLSQFANSATAKKISGQQQEASAVAESKNATRFDGVVVDKP